jgi:D-3-phosphoglycerate dehydrogenase
MSKFNVVITEPINKKGIELLEKEGINVINLPPNSKENDLLNIINDVDGLITRGSIKITREMMEKGKRLKIIGVHGMGYEHVDLASANELGKIVCNTSPEILTTTVAEMAVGLILATLRRIVSADKAVRRGEWSRKYIDLIGVELAGKTVGIIGMGRIGEATAFRLKAMKANIVYWSRTRKPDLEAKHDYKWMELEDLIKVSDIISIHIPVTKDTFHLIGKKEFELMKDEVRIINTSRGRVIDEKELINAIKKGKVAGAGLDVFEKEPLDPENPLCKMDNVILTPHLGASNREGMQRMAIQIAESVIAVFKGSRPKNQVII